MDIQAIAHRLVELCRSGDYETAQRELFADDAVSIEPEGSPGSSVKGLPAIYEKGRQFAAMVEATHGGSVSDALICGNWFSVAMTLDVTMKGRGRVNLQEICVYGVRDGKIIREQFFYGA